MTFEGLSPERAKAVLDERARALARPLYESAKEPVLACLIFAIGRERYAIETSYVRAIAKLEHFARVPGTPRFVSGVTHVRGEILAVLDLAALFELPAEGITNFTQLVVIGRERDEMAVPARDVELGELPIAKLTRAQRASHAKYVSRVSEDGIALIDGATLLDDDSVLSAQRASLEEE